MVTDLWPIDGSHVDIASEHMDRSVAGRRTLKWGGWLTVPRVSEPPSFDFTEAVGVHSHNACHT